MGKLEAAVMDVLWSTGTPLTMREVLERMPPQRNLAYTTVMTVLGRLAEKGMLERRREGRSDRYIPVLDRDAYLEARAADDVETILAAYGDVALAHFADRVERLDPQRRAQLRRLREGG